ncbi:MAG: hypothetical protein JO361_01915, partial [Gammaproteobacteria bacterium]|nr:hypothetical protein [Gammaproteobacteria bacterium]
MSDATSRAPSGLALLLALAALLLIGSGASYYLLEARAPAAASRGVPVEALYGLAIDAPGALAGDEAALARFQQSQKTLEDAAARDAGAPFTSDARFKRLMANATAVLHARTAL